MTHASLNFPTSNFLTGQKLFQEILLGETRIIITLKNHTEAFIIGLRVISPIKESNETVIDHYIAIGHMDVLMVIDVLSTVSSHVDKLFRRTSFREHAVLSFTTG